jgi:hypothetical protein
MADVIKIGQKEVALSLPYSNEEMRSAYADFVSEIDNKGEKEYFERELSQTRRDFFFADPLLLSIRIVKHLSIDMGDFGDLTSDVRSLVFTKGGTALLASIFQEKHGLSEVVSWAVADMAVRNFGR